MPDPDQTPAIRLAPITLKELTDELHAPHLLRVPTLALRPARIGISAIALLVIALLDQIPVMLGASTGPLAILVSGVGGGLGQLRGAIAAWDPAGVVDAGRALLLDVPGETFGSSPFGALLLFPVMLAVWAIAAGAVSRSAACEFAQRVHISWPQALGFGVSRGMGLAMSVILPIAFILALILLIAAGGWLLFSLPYLNVLGAVLFPVTLFLGFIAVLTLLGFLVGHWMLAPAIACEATDAIDAIQRVYHYVLHRLIHLLTHMAILALLGAILLTIGSIVVGAMDDLVVIAMERLAPDAATALLAGPDGLSGPDVWAARIIAMWRGIPLLLLGGLAVSFMHCGGAVLYLLIRDISDHQGIEEIWMPTMIEGTQAAIDADAE